MAGEVGESSSRPEATGESERRRPPFWIWIAAPIVGVALVGAAAAMQRAEPPPDRPSADVKAEGTGVAVRKDAPQWRFLKLGAVTSVGGHWTDTVQGRITIDEKLASRIGVPTAGQVTRVMVELGQSVRSGQPLFAVASPEIAQLRTERETAAVQLEAARTNATRVEAIVASRALASKELIAAKEHVREAELVLQLSEQKLAAVRAGVGNDHEIVVTAPRGGVIVEQNLLVSQQVSPDSATALMTIADLSAVWVVADVFEGQTLDLVPGDAAEVVTPSLPGQTIPGRVLMVSSVGDPERHTLPVRVQVANPGARLRPNVYARVRFSVRQPSATVEIPASALISDGAHQYVYVQQAEGHFVRRDIVAGSAHEGRLPVISGLTAGETVVEQGGILLDNQLSMLTQ